MKKIITTILAYVLFSFVICLVIANFFLKRPELLPGFEKQYIALQGVLMFFNIFPAIVASSFIVGCAISFSGSTSRFMLKHFRNIILNSVVLVSLIFVANEVIIPSLRVQEDKLEDTPIVFNDFLNLSKKCFAEGKMSLSAKFANDAILLNPKSEEALALREKALAEDTLLKESEYSKSPQFLKDIEPEVEHGNFSYHELANENVTSLLRKSAEAMIKNRWFDSHYYAYLAVKIGSDLDSNYEEAKQRAAFAWNKLNEPKEFEDTDSIILFRLKKAAYAMLASGDNVGAYYKYLDIFNNYEDADRDPDVVNYLKIAKERINEQYFFIDDVDNYRKFETNKNIYFSIKNNDGSANVVYIQGMTPIRDAGRTVQYLRGFSIYYYSKNGDFIRSITAPYAKMISEKTELFDDATKKEYSIKDEYETVPYILLCGIDSKEKNNSSFPEYEFSKNYDIQTDNINEKNLVLGISTDDFNLLCDTSIGVDNMNIISLWKIYGKAKKYGYSSEIFGASMLARVMNPLILLTLFVFLANIAWNYRLAHKQIFKFYWVLIVPIGTLIFYFIFEILKFMIKILDYVFVGFAGYYSVLIALVFALILLIVVSACFITKKD